jgi:glycosyltransferase involved in cell wall biosynthesis
MIGDFTEGTRSQLQLQADRLGCAGRLEMRDWVNRDEILKVYKEATVFAFPSIWPETLGIVGIEALSCGVPVVASDIGGVREWLLPGQTGFLAKPKSVAELAQGLEKLLFDEALNLQFGKNGIDLIKQRFTPEYHIGKLLDIYHSCLGESASRSAGAVH